MGFDDDDDNQDNGFAPNEAIRDSNSESEPPAPTDEESVASEAAVGDQKVRGRKGAGLTNLLRGVAKCICGASMRADRRGSHNEYVYLKCSAALDGKCEHRTRHRYQPIETIVVELLADIAYRDAPPVDEQTSLRAKIAHAKREAAEIERQLAILKRQHSAKLAEIADLEEQLQRQTQVGEQGMTVRRLIAGLPRLPAVERRAVRTRINAGLRRLLRGGVMISPNGDIDIYFSPSGRPGPYREIHLVPAVPDGAVVLETAEQVLAAVKAGHRVGVAPPATSDHDLG